MAASTPQTQAIAIANQLIGLSNQLIAIDTAIIQMDAQWTDQGVAATIAAMGTVTLNTDGTTGAADGAPNVAHPLDPAKYPALTRSLSSNQIGQMKTIIDQIHTYIAGQAVTTQAGARAILNAATGG